MDRWDHDYAKREEIAEEQQQFERDKAVVMPQEEHMDFIPQVLYTVTMNLENQTVGHTETSLKGSDIIHQLEDTYEVHQDNQTVNVQQMVEKSLEDRLGIDQHEDSDNQEEIDKQEDCDKQDDCDKQENSDKQEDSDKQENSDTIKDLDMCPQEEFDKGLSVQSDQELNCQFNLDSPGQQIESDMNQNYIDQAAKSLPAEQCQMGQQVEFVSTGQEQLERFLEEEEEVDTYEDEEVDEWEEVDTCEEIDMSWNGMSSDLVIGLTFQSRSQVKKFVSLYESRVKSKLIIVSGGASESSTSRKVREYNHKLGDRHAVAVRQV